MPTFAALPDHDNVHDPLWQRLFHNYRHVVAPLRYGGWVTDMELCSGEYHLTADLGDGTELLIASERSLPAYAEDVTGWNVLRRHQDDHDCHTVLYDSTPSGPQAHHGAELLPLFQRICHSVTQRTAPRLAVSATRMTPQGTVRHRPGHPEHAPLAIARFAQMSDQLTAEHGNRRVWGQHDGRSYPLALFERDGHVTALRVLPGDD